MRTHEQQQPRAPKPKVKDKQDVQRKPKTPTVSADLKTVSPQDMLHMQRLVGNRNMAALVQRNAATTAAGYQKATEFGTYWIVPDNTKQSHAGEGEQIAESTFVKVEELWNMLKDNGGQIQIDEMDALGMKHNGFRLMLLERFGMLLSRPIGRAFLLRLVFEENETITIRPIASAQSKGEEASANPVETDIVVEVDPELRDEIFSAQESNGRLPSEPTFALLGRELIFAENHIDGSNEWGIPPTDPAFNDAEHATQIAGTTVGEVLQHATEQRANRL